MAEETEIERVDFDPPDNWANRELRKLTDAELQSVMSANGYLGRIGGHGPGGTAEQNPHLHAWLSRGLWPNPGSYHAMVRQDPKIDSALNRLELSMAAADIQLPAPKGADKQVMYQCDFTREMFEVFGGPPNVVSRIVGQSYMYGFSLDEKVWQTEGKLWRIEDLVVIEPWQVYKWTFFNTFWNGAFTLPGMIWIPREKLAHHARRDHGRNPEGWSGVRSLHYSAQAKQRALVTNEITNALFGPGVVEFKVAKEGGDKDYQEARKIMRNWDQNLSTRKVAMPPFVDLNFKHGGTVKPNVFDQDVKYFDHEAGLVLEDVILDLAQTMHGSYGVGAPIQAGRDKAMTGLGMGLCRAIQDQYIRPVWQRNGWDTRFMPRPVAMGLVDPNVLRVFAEMIRDQILTRQPEDEQLLRRKLGVE